MKTPRLPLSSLRTFAVVARQLSVTKAADELNVTPSAISHHIKILEEYLGTKLLRREGNKIVLTPAGSRYASQIADGLLLLANATRTLKASKDHPILRIACPPSLGMLWLMPRIGKFMEDHPDFSVAVTSVPDPTVLLRSSFDVGLWYGEGPLTGFRVIPLSPNRVFPICSPSLICGDEALQTLEDLARCTLLDSSDDTYYDAQTQRPGWYGWLQAAGMPEIAGKRYLNFTPRLYMHQAVRDGLGVGLSRPLLTVDELSTGALVIPFGPVLEQTATYNVVYASVLAKRKDVTTFTDWVVAEAGKSIRKLGKLLTPFNDR
jgi:LysR family glycine cleavage system transcriptional activator